MEDRLVRLEQEVELLKERNRRVEGEKAWEKSSFRIACVAAVTYVVVAIVLYLIGVPNFLFAAFVPALGYVLSTLSLPALRRWWIGRR
jgi:hypothetical protein